ncbi:MAG: aminotransferase class V-fold PLP-dependent enzyme [Clostridia bacterium]|nr:aminotransferase class V-fold PLP-dependent enzyme [Clostridia bacterium]
MIYFDNSATTRVFNESVNVAVKYMTEDYFNPSGAYAPAASVERNIDGARKRLLSALGVQSGSIIFTSGATESNNFAIFGTIPSMRGKGTIIIGGNEHPSVFETARELEKLGLS